jgi:hypothetical protein
LRQWENYGITAWLVIISFCGQAILLYILYLLYHGDRQSSMGTTSSRRKKRYRKLQVYFVVALLADIIGGTIWFFGYVLGWGTEYDRMGQVYSCFKTYSLTLSFRGIQKFTFLPKVSQENPGSNSTKLRSRSIDPSPQLANFPTAPVNSMVTPSLKSPKSSPLSKEIHTTSQVSTNYSNVTQNDL